jgi:hypothetical protein
VTRSPSALLLSLLLVASCAGADPPATATVPPALGLAEADAWSKVRSSHPEVPLIIPTWLPPSIDRTRVEVRGLGFGPAGAADPVYAVAYLASSGATILFGLGSAADIPGSGYGTRVRNSHAVLSFETILFSEPNKPASRRVRWQEGNYVLRIESDRFTGDDLLHIAWSLDRGGAPAPKNPYTRVKPGVCAVRGAGPEETVRRLIGFVGGADRDAVLDCFSLELLGDYPGYGEWAQLPRASDLKMQPSSETGGRSVVPAAWTYASDPGGAWGRQAFQVFILGLEDGAWRVYETATAWFNSLP